MTTPYLTGISRILSLIGISLATFLIVLDYTIANVSLPYIAGDLAVSSDQGTYVITSFAVGNSIMLPISGWVTARMGSVKLLTWSLVGFILLSWACAICSDFSSLVICRFLQGFVAGPLIPLSQTLLISTNPPKSKTFVLAFWSMIVIAAPVVGPLLGGWLSFDYSWPWIFYINIPFGLISVLLIQMTLRKFETKTYKKQIDLVGFILLAIAVTSLQIILDKGEQFDWMRSPIIKTLSVSAFLGFAYLIAWEATHSTPLIELRLFRIRSYSVSVIFMAVMYSMYFGSVVLIPLWLQTNMGYTSIWAGIAVAPIGVAPLCFSGFSGWVIGRFGLLKPLFVCFLFFSFASFYTAFFTSQVDLHHIWASRFLLGCGLIFFITPLFALNVQDVKNEDLPSATGIFHFVRAMSGAIGTSIFTTLWIRRSAFHHATVGSSLTATDPQTKGFLHKAKSLGFSSQEQLTLLNTLLDNESAMLALNDCSYLMGWVFLFLLFLLPLGRKKEKREGSLLQDLSLSE